MGLLCKHNSFLGATRYHWYKICTLAQSSSSSSKLFFVTFNLYLYLLGVITTIMRVKTKEEIEKGMISKHGISNKCFRNDSRRA